jgi:hypothetical protein
VKGEDAYALTPTPYRRKEYHLIEIQQSLMNNIKQKGERKSYVRPMNDKVEKERSR